MEPDSTTQPSDGPPEPLPEEVERLAAARGLGSYELGTVDDHPVTSALQVAVVGALLLGAALVLHWLAGALDVRALAWVSAVFLVGALVVLGFGVVALVSGRRGMYLFSGGLVWTYRRRVESATWPEVDRLVTVGGLPPHQVPKAGQILTIDGREAFVEFGEAAAEFRDRLVAAVRAANRPVRPDVSTTGSPVPEESRARGVLLSSVASLVVLPAVLYLLLALYDAAGLPFGAALYLTFATSTLAAVLFRRMRIAAVIFAGLAGLFLTIEVNRWSDRGVLVVTAVVIAAEITTIVGWRQLARRLPAPRRLGSRRRFARKRGWSYQDVAEVPVPGPRSTHELIGVPTAATATTGEGVLVATANGFECRVYDLVRGRPRLGDPIRTVWQVTLPVSLPEYHLSHYPSWEDPPWTVIGGASQAARILTEAHRAVPVPVHPWWWVEGRYLCSWEDVHASSRVILGRMDYLTRVAAAVSWERLADPAMWRTDQPSAEPLPPWDASVLSARIRDTLRLAASEVAPGTVLTTGRVFDALARVDLMLDWQRLWLQTGTPERVGLATAPDPDGGETPGLAESPTGPKLSAQLSRALSVAEKIRIHYGHPVVTTGMVALGLVAFRGAGATEALLTGGQVDHAQLLSQIQADIVGGRFEGLRAIIPAAPD